MSVPEGAPRQPRQPRQNRHGLTREDLPAELTPETLRYLDLHTLRRLSRRGNGVLDEQEQRRFDDAYAELLRDTNLLLDESLRRAGHGGPGNLDPTLRRSYERTQQRLAEQARRARASLPAVHAELVQTGEPDPADTAEPAEPAESEAHDSTGASDDTVSPDTLEDQLEQTSATLDMLEQIASLQQQQVEHQHRQLLSETRGIFFAFLVSVAVIIAGIAPLVEAPPHDRWLIIAWTVVSIAVAGVVYALVRARQRSAQAKS